MVPLGPSTPDQTAVVLECAAMVHVIHPPTTWEALRDHAQRLAGPVSAARMFPTGLCVLGGWFVTESSG